MLIKLIAFPYDSEIIRYEEDGTPVYDRAVDSKIYRKLFLKYFTEGVFPNPSTNFQVLSNSTHGALVRAGWANVRGVLIELEKDTPITFEPAESMDRIDRIVIRHDDTKSVRNADVVILKGVASNTPSPHNITRDETIWDIVLADVRIKKNSSVVTGAQIDDKRLDKELCGIVRGTVEEIDTGTLYNQIKNDFDNFRKNQQSEYDEFKNQKENEFNEFQEDKYTEFNQWFDTIKGQLDSDSAANLQLQINDILEKLKETVYFV